MNKRLILLFLISLFIAFIIYFFQFLKIDLHYLINNYVNDFLIIPIVLFICLLFLRWSRNNKNFTLSLPIVIYLCIMYSILFEFIFPNFLARYTKDYIDVLLYFAGGLLFYLLQDKN
ncbi:hypothetical protein BTO18_05280 [Polaribacter porphyrae]|uniref:Magnesium citrate secondary transporter n=1 Tax=Polaribacter porphyrae TaxID=1137780 RepID=A0A2S7WLZ6_9FLAO|nr:hypothetical protein BTO18_05280 [Polaribacter porphyrae]